MNNHITKEGKSMPISSMEDSHLINTINFHIKRLQKAKELLNSGFKENKFINTYQKRYINLEDVEDYIQEFDEKIAKYIYEANIRDLNIRSSLDVLRNIIERDSKDMYDCEFEQLEEPTDEIIF